jgi:hypothetical protein
LTQEDLEKSGVIPFYEDEHGFNPGRLLEVFLLGLHPENVFLFQRPAPQSTQFNIHQERCNVWFTKAKIGKNKVGKLLPLLCQTVGVSVLGNHSIRASSIRALKRANFEDRVVATLSGHKNLANLSNYQGRH